MSVTTTCHSSSSIFSSVYIGGLQTNFKFEYLHILSVLLINLLIVLSVKTYSFGLLDVKKMSVGAHRFKWFV